MSLLNRASLAALAALAASALAAGASQAAQFVTYNWTTTSQGVGLHLGQPTTASFQVDLAKVQTGSFSAFDITNLQLTYPGLSFQSTVVSSIGFDFAAFVNPVTGALIFHDTQQGLAVEAFAGTDINQATTFLSILVDNPVSGVVKDSFNALNQGNPAAGFPTKGFWTASLPIGGGVPEPATWAMMIAGFGGVGAMMRRRQSKALAA